MFLYSARHSSTSGNERPLLRFLIARDRGLLVAITRPQSAAEREASRVASPEATLRRLLPERPWGRPRARQPRQLPAVPHAASAARTLHCHSRSDLQTY